MEGEEPLWDGAQSDQTVSRIPSAISGQNGIGNVAYKDERSAAPYIASTIARTRSRTALKT